MVDAETGLLPNANSKTVIYESFKTKDNFMTNLEKSFNKDRLEFYDFEIKDQIFRFY